MNYGDIGKRIAAALIDGLIVGVIGGVVTRFLWYAGIYSLSFIVVPVFSWLYYILMEGGSMHATLGKRAMDLYVADSRGYGIDYSTAFLRMLGKLLCSFTIGIGYIMCLFNDQKQGLHDMVAKTFVLSGQPGVSRPSAGGSGMHELVGITGPLAGTVHPIYDKGLLIGRDSVGCDIVIPASQGKVSRIHCYVTYNPQSNMFILNDRGSTHGTFLANGKRIVPSQPEALSSGARFYVATPENTFEVR